MKKFVKNVMVLMGVFIVIGTAGSLEQDMITLTQSLLGMIYGGLIACAGWLFYELAEVYRVVKKGRKYCEKKHNCIEFKSIA